MEKLDRASPDIWPERNCIILKTFKLILEIFIQFVLWFLSDPDIGIGYVIEPPSTSLELPSPQSILPQELDKHDYALIGSMHLKENNKKYNLLHIHWN